MGLYDREYYRDENETGFTVGQQSMVTTLILINVAIFVIDVLAQGKLSDVLALRADVFTHPWNAWQLFTAGFAHDHRHLVHILFNMYGLWLFGRDVEGIYGRAEFLRLYLSLVVLASAGWVLCENLAHGFQPWGAHPPAMVGASGAVTGVMVLFACHFPARTFLFFGVLPLPAWILITFFILMDVLGATGRTAEGNVAYTAHLTGAAFGYLYYKSSWNLGRLFGRGGLRNLFRRRPKLRLHRGGDEATLNTQVDQILEKISREGEASLTRSERRLLESASRRYQQRRQ